MELQYRGKHLLAAMVCGGTLPFRMLAPKYGADVTYGEEIVDHRLLRSTRKINKMLGTVDLVEKDTDTVLSGHVMKRRVMWFSKLGFLMLCGLYKLLILSGDIRSRSPSVAKYVLRFCPSLISFKIF
jgi:hypothetical protein